MLWILLGILALAGVVLLLQGGGGDVAGLSQSMIAQAAIGAALLLFIGGSVLRDYQGRYGQALKDLMIWVAIGFVLVLGYSYKDQFQAALGRVAGELNPSGTPVAISGSATSGERTVQLRRRSDGHFAARIEVDGIAIPMLIDTGATTVALKNSDARAIGIDVDRLTYSVPVNTANGLTYSASVRVKRMKLGSIVIENVDAKVSKPGALTESLLGMSFLTRLRSYEVSGEFMTLRE